MGQQASPADSPFSSDEYEVRVQKALRMMETERLDALLCYASKIMPGNVRYFTGYETRLGIHDASFFLITPGTSPEFRLFSNATWEHPEEQSWVSSVILTSNFGPEIAACLSSATRRLGVAGYKYLPLSVYLGIRGRWPEMEVVDSTEPATKLRSVKSEAEIQVLRRCAEVTDRGGKAFLNGVKVGASEREIAAEVERAMKVNGCDEVSYTTQVGCGEKTSEVVIFPSDHRVLEGEPVQVDCGATYRGYRGDFSRVTVVGRTSEEYERMLEATAQMYLGCLEKIRPGVLASDVARAGMEVAKAHQLDRFLYVSPNVGAGFMGHGIGCHYHELPDINLHDHTTLEENMVVVLEPILTRPGLGGVKLEDAVRVTRTGAERLSSCELRSWANA